MTPNTIECPACHTPNPVTATQCTRCATPFPFDERTILGPPQKSPTRPPTSSAAPKSISGEGTLEGTPQDIDATFLGADRGGDITDLSAKGWSRAAPATSVRLFPGGKIPPGTLLGTRYEIVQMLGEGGMGAVYKAMDRELERMVALKIIKPELAMHEGILARFKQELILARRITHKNVIRIFDLGDADGLKFITMEFIEGKDLSSLIKEKGRLSFAEWADYMSQVCTALDAAHTEGVVHRDLKPQNKSGGAVEKKMDRLGTVLLTRDKLPNILGLTGCFHVSTLVLKLVLLGDDLRLRVGWERVRVFLSAAGWDGGSRVPFSSLGKADAFEKVSKHGSVHASDGVLGVFAFVRNGLCPLFLVA